VTPTEASTQSPIDSKDVWRTLRHHSQAADRHVVPFRHDATKDTARTDFELQLVSHRSFELDQCRPHQAPANKNDIVLPARAFQRLNMEFGIGR
jgi:hypothetical protein